MPYHPYFRGKQFELVAIRETAGRLAAAEFTPIIEPVREQLSGLQKTLDALCDAHAFGIVVTNPQFGDHNSDSAAIAALLQERYQDKAEVVPGFLLTADTQVQEVVAFCAEYSDQQVALVHAGFSAAKDLLAESNALENASSHIFVGSGKLYQKNFAGAPTRVLIRDGFQWRPANRDYPPSEFFSDLHITFPDEGMTGFGDFLMVGDRYYESGGPAYAVAIHITYIDDDQEDQMYIFHFVSDSQDTPTNPAGKFAEAVAKLVNAANAENSKIFESTAIAEFRELHLTGHYPGLGYVKKLSMKHHIETLAKYFSET